MTSHDIDGRFSGAVSKSNTELTGQKKISMVANLYLPLIAICLDNLPKVLILETNLGVFRVIL